MSIERALIILLVLFLLGAGLYTFVVQYHVAAPAPLMTELSSETIQAGTSTLLVEVADNDATREQGLSGRVSLPEGKGMLFVFQQDGDWGFWMKDMQFPLDLIFIGSSGAVITVDANASPDTYNAQDPSKSQVFYPAIACRYVLEVPAGYAAAHGIVAGTALGIPGAIGAPSQQ